MPSELNKFVEEVRTMYYKADEISSTKMMDEVKERIKDKFHSQAKAGEKVYAGRKTINRILNNDGDIKLFFELCKVLGIKEIHID